MMFRRGALCGFLLYSSLGIAADEPQPVEPDVAKERLELMRSRIGAIKVISADPQIPKSLQDQPLFRYDDATRGYVDGTVWRLGRSGRPYAIITAELHPRYLNGGSRIVYDMLSLTREPFTVKSSDLQWRPGGSAVSLNPVPNAAPPADTAVQRLVQIKELSRRFTATQHIVELDDTFVHLRLLPKEIDRYRPTEHRKADGALFLFVNGRNPGLLLLVETDGEAWSYGVGRLSMPSTLTLKLDDSVVWTCAPGSESNGSYSATNSAASFP